MSYFYTLFIVIKHSDLTNYKQYMLLRYFNHSLNTNTRFVQWPLQMTNSLRHDKLIESAVLMINHKDTKSEV